MSYIDTTADNFKMLHLNGYTSKEVTLLESQNIQKLTGGNIPRFGMLPACHLNFGNIGKIKFDFGLPSADPLNLNMFNKLSRLSDIIRGINARCITLIEELKCCSLAELYNSMVIPIFEWVLKDFINTLVSIAEAILKSYQVMKVIFCIVRPVPGNPWLRGAGFDFLKYLYSFVEGFETVYLWLVDGNPVDMLLNPAEAFYKKISSCSPDKKRNQLLQDDELLQKTLTNIIASFNETRGQNKNQADLDQANAYNISLLEMNKEYSELFYKMDDYRDTLFLLKLSDNIVADTKIIETYEKMDVIEQRLNILQTEIKEKDELLNNLYLREEQEDITNEKLINRYLAQRTLDKMIIDAYNPVCSCLLEMAGIHGFSPPNVMTLNTWESFHQLAEGRVIWADKQKWVTAIEKARAHKDFGDGGSTLYISKDNFVEKFAASNKTVERNLLTRYVNGYALNGNDLFGVENYGDIKIYIKSIDESGSEFTAHFEIPSDYTNVDRMKIYSDSGEGKHSNTNITEVFDLNGERIKERNIQTKEISKLHLEKRRYEKDLEACWNVLRKLALKELAYGKHVNDISDEFTPSDKTLFNSVDEFFTGVMARAGNLYDTTVGNSTEKITVADIKLNDPASKLSEIEKQKIVDERNAVIEQRKIDIATSTKTYYETKDAAWKDFKDVMGVMANTIVNLPAIAVPTHEQLEAQRMLNRLGTSFDIISFIDLYNPNTESDVIIPTTIIDFDVPKSYDVMSLIKEWSQLTIKSDIRTGMIARLDRLVEIDNFMVSFVDDELQICGCDILCVILQQLLDIVTSAINALIKTVIDRLIKMIVSEQAAYIIKMITEKLKCFLMAKDISKNIKKIGDLSKALKKKNKQRLDRAEDPAGCDIQESGNLSTLGKLHKDDEILLNLNSTDNIMVDENGDSVIIDPILHPMPTWGVDSVNDVREPENTLVNNGADMGESTTGRNVPELYFDCSHGKLPNLEVEIVPTAKFEILIAFIPGESIIDAEVISTPQTLADPLEGVTDANGDPIVLEELSNNPIMNLAEIMAKVNTQVNAALNAPIYVEDSCSPKKINNTDSKNLTLCSRDNLSVSDVVIIENDTIVTDYHLGKISAIRQYDASKSVYEYYPEHKDADANGMVKLGPDNSYWVYSTPATETKILDPIITTVTEIVPDDTIIDNTNVTTTRETIENFMRKITTTTIDISFNRTASELEKIVTTTIDITLIIPFRMSNLELLVTFKNSVNYFKIRAMLDVVAYELDDSSIKYRGSSYNGRYREYVELGAVPAGTGFQYVISYERLLFLSSKILKTNYLLTNAQAVADTIPRKAVAPNKCLLPADTKQSLIDTESAMDNINLAISEATFALEGMIDGVIPYEIPEPFEIKISPLLKSIPFLVLNKELGILVQIVNRKIYLQFPSNSFHISEPTIIDYELIPGEVYMFVFNTNGLTFKMSIITPDKEVFTATGMNISLASLQPSIIGGNENKTSSMCQGTILDIIISRNGNNTIDYYNRSLMGYIPRLSQVLFDFSLVQGSRTYNTITDIGDGYATKIPRAGFLSHEYGYGTATELAKQQSDYYGTIISNDFYQILDGYMDNFFCKDNLGDRDFTISLWIYNTICRTNHHSIISDDIGKNYIYFDAAANKIVIDFFGQSPINIGFILNDWTNITFRHNKYLKTFYLTVYDIRGNRKDMSWISTNKFSLMSIFAEYNYATKEYYRDFKGFLSTISIFMSDIDERTYKNLYKNQKLLVQGMEKIREVEL